MCPFGAEELCNKDNISSSQDFLRGWCQTVNGRPNQVITNCFEFYCKPQEHSMEPALSSRKPSYIQSSRLPRLSRADKRAETSGPNVIPTMGTPFAKARDRGWVCHLLGTSPWSPRCHHTLLQPRDTISSRDQGARLPKARKVDGNAQWKA